MASTTRNNICALSNQRNEILVCLCFNLIFVVVVAASFSCASLRPHHFFFYVCEFIVVGLAHLFWTLAAVSPTEYIIEQRLCMLMGQQQIRAHFLLPVNIANSNRFIIRICFFSLFCISDKYIFGSVSVLCFRFHGKVLNSHSRPPFQKYRRLGYRHNSSRFLFFFLQQITFTYFRMNSIEDFRPMCCCHCYRCSFVFFLHLYSSRMYLLCVAFISRLLRLHLIWSMLRGGCVLCASRYISWQNPLTMTRFLPILDE